MDIIHTAEEAGKRTETVGKEATEIAGMAGKINETEIKAIIQTASGTRTTGTITMTTIGGHQVAVGEDHAEEIPKQAIQTQGWGLGNFQHFYSLVRGGHTSKTYSTV